MKNLMLFEDFQDLQEEIEGSYQAAQEFSLSTMTGTFKLPAGSKITIKKSGMPLNHTVLLPKGMAKANSKILLDLINDGTLVLEPYEI